MENEEPKTISVLVNKICTTIVISQILYCASAADYTFIYMVFNPEKFLKASGNLKETGLLIHSEIFVRTHRQYLINSNYYMCMIKEKRKGFLKLEKNIVLPIPEKKYAQLHKKLKALKDKK